MRDRHRRQLAEGLLGRAAIVVEEESIRQWILRTSALLHGADYDGSKRSALELHGVSVLTAEGNGEVAKLAALLSNAGIPAIGFLDQVNDTDFEQFSKAGVSLIFHPSTNLEDLLVNALARAVLEEILSAPSAYKKNTYDKVVLVSLSEEELRAKAKTFLTNHKGYIPFHEEILEGLGDGDMPTVMKRLVCLAADLANGVVPDSQSIVPS